MAVSAASAQGGRYFENSVAVAPQYVGEADWSERVTEGVMARALAVGDFDEDGVPDLAVAVATPAGAVLVLYRGDVDAMYPNSVEAKKRRAAGRFTQFPFRSPARVCATPANADLLKSGDYDADGHLDLLTASIDDNRLSLHRGNGRGLFEPAISIGLPGTLTALTSGEINRRDGLADVVAAVQSKAGAQLLVFEDPAGAFAAEPETVDLQTAATDLALGQLDGRPGFDLAVAAGSGLSILHGRDRQRSAGAASAPLMSRLVMPQAVVAVTIGDFVSEEPSRPELAVLFRNGAIRLVARPRLKRDHEGWTSIGRGDWRLSREIGHLENEPITGARVDLLGARISGNSTDDLVVLAGEPRRIQVLAATGETKIGATPSRSRVRAPAPLAAANDRGASIFKADRGVDEQVAETSPPPSRSVAVAAMESAPRDAVSLRLNTDALDDLVVLVDSRPEPIVLWTKALEVVVVNSTTDVVDGVTSSISELNAGPGADGVISLREAITAANNTTGADTINFNIPVDTDPGCDVGSGVCTIQPGGFGLPTITQPVTIDGTTQPTFMTTPVIEIDGSLASTDATGLAITAGSSTIRGLVVNRFATNSDIVMWSAGGNIVEGNFLGVDASGTSNQGTTNSVHVYAISNNVIGGTIAAARNVISGNTNPAIALNAGASNNSVQGNYIGTDLTGTIALGNSGNDVVTLDSPDNTIGGTAPGEGNLIAGNLDPDFASVGLGLPGSTGNLVQGNFVGTDVTGTVDLGGASIAVYIVEGSSNTIGGTSPSAGNLISGAESPGVGIAAASGNSVQGNLIGTQADGVTPLPNTSHGILIYSGALNNTVGGRVAGSGNTVAFNGGSGIDLRGDAGVGNTLVGNSIAENVVLGIDFCADFDVGNLLCNDLDRVTPNDSDDPDTGANNLQNFPVLTAVHDGSVVDGTLDSIASSDFTVDLYASSGCDPSGHGEGEIYLGSEIVTTDANGDTTFTTTLTSSVPGGWYVTATATDAAGSTSEFSQCFEFDSGLIFADGFESGDIAAWSSSVP